MLFGTSLFSRGGRGITVLSRVNFFVLSPQRFPSDEITFQRRETDRHSCRRQHRVNRNVFSPDVRTQLVSVQKKTCLLPERIPCAKAHRDDSPLCALRKDHLPKESQLLPGHKELEAEGLARIAGPRNDDPGPFHPIDFQPVSPGIGKTQDLLQDRLGPGTLKCHHPDLLRLLLEEDIRETLLLVHEPVPVLLTRGGIDHQKIPSRPCIILIQPVEVGIVKGTSRFIRDQGILGHSGVEGQGIIRQNMLQEGNGAFPGYEKAAHVGDIEEPAESPRPQMLFEDAPLVGYGHLPSPEIDHLTPMLTMPCMERGLLQFPLHFDLPSSLHSTTAGFGNSTTIFRPSWS